MAGIVPNRFFNMWRARRIQRPIRNVIDPPSLLQASGFFPNFMISTLVTLTAQLEVAEKALSKEKDARLAANRFLAEEKAARQIANQPRWAFEEATVALTYDLLSAQASITATMEKLAAKSSALDITVIQEREVELKLQTYEEKRKAQE
jgi:hypothetical protein